MKFLKYFKSIMLVYILIIFYMTSYCQNHYVFSSCGESLNNGQLTTSVGQVFVNRNKNNSLSINEGFQQSWITEMFTITNETKMDTYLEIFPNPSIDFLNIRSNTSIHSWRIISLNGIDFFYKSEVQNSYDQIDINSLLAGMYWLEITYTDGRIEQKKFIKL